MPNAAERHVSSQMSKALLKMPHRPYRKCIYSNANGVKLSVEFAHGDSERRNGMKKSTALVFIALVAFAVNAPGVRAQTESDPLRRWDESVDALLRRVSPSVVQIMVTGYGTVSEGDRGNAGVVIGKQKAIGSGFVIDASGYILANAHVVNGAQRVQVALPPAEADGSVATALASKIAVLPARIVGVSREIDLA